jgi:hypothetical protein
MLRVSMMVWKNIVANEQRSSMKAPWAKVYDGA